MTWTPSLKQVTTIYPAAIGSKNWPEIVRLANAGKVDDAKELAARGEVNKAVLRRNVIARRLRIERAELFMRVTKAEKALRAMLDHFTEKLAASVEANASDAAKQKRINELIHDETVMLRASMRIWVNAAIRDSAKMGFRHLGDALLPIFKANRESAEREFIAERALFEAKLVFGMNTAFANRTNPTVPLGSDKWLAKKATVIRTITKRNLVGLNPSERVWELTTRAEQDLKRLVANGMAAGENPAVIARKIKRYISPTVTNASKLGVDVGPGVYRSPYRNAMRLARTEMNRTYTKAQVAFAKDKPWCTGVRITLSPAHAESDECDELASRGVMKPEEAEKLVPAHPHCMCYLYPEIDPKYLGEEEA